MVVQKRKKRKKVVLYILTFILLLASFLVVTNYDDIVDLINYKKTIQELQIGDVDLSSIPDGQFTGYFDAKLVKVEALVTVENHKITEIKLLQHVNGRGENAEVMPQRIIQAQSLQVDVVTNATASSKVILKAVENALNQL